MKKIKTILLLIIMTLLSNVTFGQMSYTVTIGTYTETFAGMAGMGGNLGDSLTISTRTNGDSIIYEFPNQTGNLDFKLDISLIDGDGPNIGNLFLLKNDNTPIGSSILDVPNNIITTYTITTFTTNTTTKLALYYNLGINKYIFVCYVRNYHDVKTLPSTFTIPGITNFINTTTTYTATTTPTTLSNIPTGWGQTLTTVVSSTTCITSYGITDCASTTVLQIINPDGDLTYTITYNRPAQTPTDPNSTTGISENENIELVLYPNPTTDIINFNSSSKINKISVFSLGGQLMLSNAKQTSINVSNLSQGYYIVHIELENTIIKKQFLKNK